VNKAANSLDPYGKANSLVLWTYANSLGYLVFDGHSISRPLTETFFPQHNSLYVRILSTF